MSASGGDPRDVTVGNRVTDQTQGWAVRLGGLDRRIAWFVDQVRRTIRRPSRLFFVPFSYLFLSGESDLALRILRLIPKRLCGRRASNELNFIAGHQLLQLNRPVAAWQYFEQCLRDGSDPQHLFIGALCLYHGLGRFAEAQVLLRRANDIRDNEARQLGVAEFRGRVLDDIWTRHIGHTAGLDYVIKLGILEGRERDDTLLYIPSTSHIANRFLLDQVRPLLKLVERPADLPFGEPAVKVLRFDYLGPRMPDGTTVYFWDLAARTYRRWHAEGRPPLLTFPPETDERGWRALRGVGVPPGAWFVAMHVRAGAWKRHHLGLHQVLNAEIATYLPAIAEVTRRGGWVIRMGDATMPPLPPMPNVIDYCHSDLRADWMDVFLAARCRFMLGTSSGPAYLAPLYGVPSVLTNWWPPAQRPWHAMDLFVPKMQQHIEDGRYLTLRETLAEPYSYCHSVDYLAETQKVRVVDNDPDVICAAVAEMLDRLDRTGTLDAEVEHLRAEASRIYDACGAHGMGQLAGGFVRAHAAFMK
jgi:putative glycosyltransferase (TIGR04372 family)